MYVGPFVSHCFPGIYVFSYSPPLYMGHIFFKSAFSRDTIQYFNNSFRNAIYDTISENVTITCHVIGNALNDCLGCKDECSNEIDDCPGEFDLNQCKTCDECKSNFRWYHNGGQ